jgi:hypothetical protein
MGGGSGLTIEPSVFCANKNVSYDNRVNNPCESRAKHARYALQTVVAGPSGGDTAWPSPIAS